MSAIPDAVSAAPDIYRVLLKYDRVRVHDVRLQPGCQPADALAPRPRLLLPQPGNAQVHLPSGESIDVELRPGEAMWIDAQTHATDKVGPTETHDLTIELKQP